jgi:predicted negative regulator of RcsB-dependent stress response
VLADTFARLAELRSALGEFDAALGDVRRGLELAVEPTHFRGRLMEVRGLVEERHAKALEDRGDAKAALAAKERALAAYEQAVEIQDQVIARTLGDAGARQPAAADAGLEP